MAMDETNNSVDRGSAFDGVKIGRPATRALINAGFESLSDLPVDLESLIEIHGVGPKAISLLQHGRGELGT
ncbi:MAG: hypothetical protein V9G09_01680 [Candidatus Nanopelagicales bacterium]